MNLTKMFSGIVIVAVLLQGCNLPLDLGVPEEGVGDLTITFQSSRSLSEVGYLTVQIIHDQTKAVKFKDASVSGSVTTLGFTGLASGYWQLKAFYYTNSTDKTLLYYSYDKVFIKSGQSNSASLLAISLGSLTSINLAEAQVPTAITLKDQKNFSSSEIPAGLSLNLVATVNSPDPQFQYLQWYSSNPALASVDEFGRVFAHRPGTVEIWTVENRYTQVESGHYILTVLPEYMGSWLSMANGTQVFNLKSNFTFDYFMDGYGEKGSYKGTWSENSGSLVFSFVNYLDPVTGTFLNYVPAPVYVSPWYSQGGKLYLKEVLSSTSLLLSTFSRTEYRPATGFSYPQGALMPGGSNLDFLGAPDTYPRFTLAAIPSASPPPTLFGVLWSSSNPGVATLDLEGNLQILGEGSSTLRVISLDGVSASVNLVVSNLPEALAPLGLNGYFIYDSLYGEHRNSITWYGPNDPTIPNTAWRYSLERSVSSDAGITWSTYDLLVLGMDQMAYVDYAIIPNYGYRYRITTDALYWDDYPNNPRIYKKDSLGAVTSDIYFLY